MPQNAAPPRKPLAIHPRRNLPSSLLLKRCKDRFAQVLQEYGDEEGYPVEWALIFESGRQNKMLLVDVYGSSEEFPITWVNSKGVRVSLEEGGDEGEWESVEGGDEEGDDDESLGEEDGEKVEKVGVKKMMKGDDGEGSNDGDGDESTEDAADAKDANEEDQIFTITEKYKLPGNSDDADNPETEPKNEAVLKETYEIVGAIMEGEVHWMCDLPQYEGYEDKTTYFNKDGLSMVHGVRFQDRVKERKLAALAEFEKQKQLKQEILVAEQKAKKTAKKMRQKAGVAAEHSEVEEAASTSSKKARAKRARQKKKREEAEERWAEEKKAMEEAQEEAQAAAAKALFKEHTGQELKYEDLGSRMVVVNADTPEGALAIAELKKHGGKAIPVNKIG